MTNTPAHPYSGGKLPLSAVFITLNAANQLEAALKSVQFCSDLVVVDSGSTDGTLELAARYGARVFQQEWIGFGPQKHHAVQLAQFDWVLCLDADEQISPELRVEIEGLFAGQTPKAHGFDMPRCNHFLGRYLRHGEGYPDYSRRLFNRQHAKWSADLVHEKVETQAGAVFERLRGDIVHDSAETLNSYLSKQNRYTSIQAEALAQAGKWPSLAKLVLSPMVRFVKFYIVRQGFRDGWAGFVHISIGCFNSFMKYAKTRELMIRNRSK